MSEIKKVERVFTVQFDLIIPVRQTLDPKEWTLPQHEVFQLVKKQIKASFDTDVCSTRNYKMGNKCVNPMTQELDRKGELV